MEREWTPQVRTPPAIKWLLNERAALAGRICKLDEKLAGIADRQALAQRQVDRMAKKHSEGTAQRADVLAKLEALDRVMEAQYAALNPAAGGVVRERAGKYGALGGLKRYVLSVVQASGLAGIATGELAMLTAAHFGLEMLTPHTRLNFRRQLRTLLRTEPQLVEERSAADSRGNVFWRRKQPSSLAALQAEAQRHEAEDAVGGEVAWQTSSAHSRASSRSWMSTCSSFMRAVSACSTSSTRWRRSEA